MLGITYKTKRCRFNSPGWGQHSVTNLCCHNELTETFVSEIIDDLVDHMDQTDDRIRNETRHVTVIDRKDKTCCKFCY